MNDITDDAEKKSVEKLSRLSGNPRSTMQLHQSRLSFYEHLSGLKNIPLQIIEDARLLKYAATPDDFRFRIERLRRMIPAEDAESHAALSKLEKEISTYNSTYTRYRNYIPAVEFHPVNQYHRWVFGDGNWLTGNGAVNSSGIIRGDFGLSYLNRQPVSQVIGEKVGWSLFFALASVFMAYLLSIPLGVWAGAKKDSVFDRVSSIVLFLLYSLPVFWVATLLLMTFANPDVLHFFPASGIKPVTGYPDNASIFDKMQLSLPYVILPMICYTYWLLAILSRTLRVSVLENMSQDYIRTAKAKGLPFRLVVFRHALRNSLLPLITIFGGVFPLAISGSVILETIFTIPGMGFETIHSIQNQNYPMIVAIFTITGVLTMTGYLVADILYAIADPRIIFEKKS